MATLVHAFIAQSAALRPDAAALTYQGCHLNYAALAQQVDAAAAALLALGLHPAERVGIYLEKCVETVAALFGSTAAGGIMVPVNPLLKPEQVAYICGDCNVRILVTSADRLLMLAPVLSQCPDLQTVVVVGTSTTLPDYSGLNIVSWDVLMASVIITSTQAHRSSDSDLAAILYTSGSTGKPKGVMLSHRNLVVGARSVAEYLENTQHDRILSVLPLSFDYGLSQLTTAFSVGASVVLMNYLLPQDIIAAVEEEGITGLAAVPPLWNQLAQRQWPQTSNLRYITNSGGAMPRTTLDALRHKLPQTKVFLMYGLTEAFRSTYLPPAQLALRPDSIGRAIPNAEVMVVRSDGSECNVDEPGELIHKGPLVAQGYWGDPEKTAERFKPVPGNQHGQHLTEIAVWSGDTVRRDAQGYLYFIGRFDDMIKVSGYRVSPTEVEEVILTINGVIEAVAIGVPHPVLGAAIAVIVQSMDDLLTPQMMTKECQRRLPAYMVPAQITIQRASLPRNPNGKIDRKSLQSSLAGLFNPS